jgi:hypothetical protein
MVRYVYDYNGKSMEENIPETLAEHLNIVHTNVEFFLDWCEEMSDIIYGDPRAWEKMDTHRFRDEVNEMLYRMKDLED